MFRVDRGELGSATHMCTKRDISATPTPARTIVLSPFLNTGEDALGYSPANNCNTDSSRGLNTDGSEEGEVGTRMWDLNIYKTCMSHTGNMQTNKDMYRSNYRVYP